MVKTSVCSLRSFITGESVEENAYMVLRLLIRRPECFGPALQGDGGTGLLVAMREAIRISDDPSMDGPSCPQKANRTMSVVNIWRIFMVEELAHSVQFRGQFQLSNVESVFPFLCELFS